MFPRSTDAPQVRPSSDNHLAEVVSVEDVGSTGRIQVRLLGYDGVDSQDGLLEARVCVPVAGKSRGTFFIPEVGDEVLLGFINGDRRQAFVFGSFWNGANQPKERLGGDGKHVDRWTIVGKQGTRIALVEEGGGTVIRLSVSDQTYCEISGASGGSIELVAGSSTLRLDQQGVTIQTSGNLQAKASASSVTSATLDVSAGQSTFSGAVQAGPITTPSIVAATYSPGAGNVW